MRKPARLSAKVDSMIETWVSRLRIGNTYNIELLGSEQWCSEASLELNICVPPDPPPPERAEEERARLRQFYEEAGGIFMPPVTVLRVTLPLDHELAEPAVFRDWALGFQALAQGDFAGGHAGLALNFDDTVSLDSLRTPMTSKLAALPAHHPGLDWDRPSAVIRHLLRYQSRTVDFVPQIKRVNWLTLIPNATAAELGGREQVAATLQPRARRRTASLDGGASGIPAASINHYGLKVHSLED